MAPALRSLTFQDAGGRDPKLDPLPRERERLIADLGHTSRAMILRNFEDELRHMTWLRGAVVVRGWDVEQPEIRQLAEQVRKAA